MRSNSSLIETRAAGPIAAALARHGGLLRPETPSVQPLSPWQVERLGKITGSQFHRVTRGRGGKGWSQTAESYLYELVFEHITGQPATTFSGNAATDWGKEHEPEAIRIYEERIGNKVKKGQFFAAPGFRLVGCTPDGVGKKGLEAKCPYGPKNHVRTLIDKCVPDEYEDQVQGHMLCTGRDYCDFVSFDPRMPIQYGFVLVEVERSPSVMQELRERLEDFELHLIETLENLEIDWRNPVWK
jgi:hypothetical protein